MSIDLSQTTETFLNDDQSWLGSRHGTNEGDTVTLDPTTFDLVTKFPNGFIPSGVIVAKITSGGNTGMYGPYSPGTLVNEVQLLTPGGTISGGTWTITYGGETTAAIAFNANAATIQAALEDLGNITPGEVVVTGGPISSGVVTLTFSGGDEADTNVPQVTVNTAALTGTAPTLTPSTSVGGGGTGAATDGRQDPATTRLLLSAVKAKNGDTNGKVSAVIWHGQVIVSKLPANNGLDTPARNGGLRLVDFQ